MLIILTTHPIQYQIPLWQALARDGRIAFEVWYLTDFGTKPSADQEFGRTFSWDISLLSGYPYRFVKTADGASPTSFWRCRLRERLRDRLRQAGATALWIQGWQVLGYWQAVWEARAAGVKVWIRAESNDLSQAPWWKRGLKRLFLGQFFSRIEEFLCIGTANSRLYQRYGVAHAHLHPAPYAIDNDRFAEQAELLRAKRSAVRAAWNIPDDAYCALFCGKFVPKKRPTDLVIAAQEARRRGLAKPHLLFVGSGELGNNLRDAVHVAYDAEDPHTVTSCAGADKPSASFAGFLNQTEISRAYVAADCLVLPSDHGETWGLVVNEALASGLPCIVSDACGCAEDLIRGKRPELTFPLGDTEALAQSMMVLAQRKPDREEVGNWVAEHTFHRTVQTVVALAGAA